MCITHVETEIKFFFSKKCRTCVYRKHMHLPFYNCVLCSSNSDETVQHLFLECEMAKACWNLVGITINLALDHLQILESFKMQLNVSFYMEIIIIMSWSIWTIRNDVIFRTPCYSSKGFRCFQAYFWLAPIGLKRNTFLQLSYG